MVVMVALLEKLLKDENEKLKALKQIVDSDIKDKDSIKKNILKNTRDAKSYRDSLKNFTQDEFKRQLDELIELRRAIESKHEKLTEVNKQLQEFDGVEPTNEALRDKIDHLKKSRLSLEMSFLDSTQE